jgi:hypothetical protein
MFKSETTVNVVRDQWSPQAFTNRSPQAFGPITHDADSCRGTLGRNTTSNISIVPTRKVQIPERVETMGDVPNAPNVCGRTLRVKYGPCNVVLLPVWYPFSWIVRSARKHD